MCYSTDDFPHRYDIKSYSTSKKSEPRPKQDKMIEEVSGYKIDGYPEIYNSYNEALEAKRKIDKRKRYEELDNEFKMINDLRGYLKSGICDIDEFTDKLVEFWEIRKQILMEAQQKK